MRDRLGPERVEQDWTNIAWNALQVYTLQCMQRREILVEQEAQEAVNNGLATATDSAFGRNESLYSPANMGERVQSLLEYQAVLTWSYEASENVLVKDNGRGTNGIRYLRTASFDEFKAPNILQLGSYNQVLRDHGYILQLRADNSHENSRCYLYGYQRNGEIIPLVW